MAMGDILYLVIPCFNEEEVLPETYKRLKDKMEVLIKQKTISKNSRVVFIDDGSSDETWEQIEHFHKQDNLFSGLKLSKNRGHQNALLAGLMTARECADVVISMDSDLQDDIDAIDRFLEQYNDGADIVYGVRSKRKKDSMFKRSTAQSFYKLMNMFGANVVYNHADYRLMSKRALDALAEFKEVNLFLRGMVTLVGFTTATVEYERSERFAGESKYPLGKMLSLAFDGITSFSIKPIRMITGLGIFIIIVCLAAIIYTLLSMMMGYVVTGWSSTMLSIWLIGGIQVASLGVIGEYIGKIYVETKARPRFIIEQFINKK